MALERVTERPNLWLGIQWTGENLGELLEFLGLAKDVLSVDDELTAFNRRMDVRIPCGYYIVKNGADEKRLLTPHDYKFFYEPA